VIVCFVDIGGIVDHHLLNFPLVKCDCLFYIAIVHIVMKESLNSDGQQFHQYQQNKQSHFTKGKFKQ
jgi:hypothetical protein